MIKDNFSVNQTKPFSISSEKSSITASPLTQEAASVGDGYIQRIEFLQKKLEDAQNGGDAILTLDPKSVSTLPDFINRHESYYSLTDEHKKIIREAVLTYGKNMSMTEEFINKIGSLSEFGRLIVSIFQSGKNDSPIAVTEYKDVKIGIVFGESRFRAVSYLHEIGEINVRLTAIRISPSSAIELKLIRLTENEARSELSNWSRIVQTHSIYLDYCIDLPANEAALLVIGAIRKSSSTFSRMKVIAETIDHDWMSKEDTFAANASLVSLYKVASAIKNRKIKHEELSEMLSEIPMTGNLNESDSKKYQSILASLLDRKINPKNEDTAEDITKEKKHVSFKYKDDFVVSISAEDKDSHILESDEFIKRLNALIAEFVQ